MVSGLKRAGLKLTPQRLAIVEALADDVTHPTAQEIYERLRPRLPMMSFATVYSTLDTLARAGLCQARSLTPGATRFDPNVEPHDHVVCDQCGAMRDVPATSGARENVGVEGFEVHAVELVFRGVCASCRATGG